MAGTDAFDVQASAQVLFDAPPDFEFSPTQPHDGGQPLVYGSAATEHSLTSYPSASEPTVLAEDPGVFQPQVQPRFAPAASNDEEGFGGSAASGLTVSDLANRPQYSSAQVYKEDPGVSNLDPGLALPYGNNELGPNAVTGTVVIAPQGSAASGAVNPLQDPSVLIPDYQPLPAGTNDSITGASVKGALTGGASGAPPVLDHNVEALNPVVTLAATGEAVSDTLPTAPVTGGEASAQVVLMTQGEAGHITPAPPTSQYGQSAP